MAANSSNLLIDEHPLQVLPSLAKLVGLDEALVLQQIHYWTKIVEKEPRKNKDKFREGCYWIYNSYTDWQQQFPFWSKPTIERTIRHLEAMGLIKVGNFNKMAGDKTKWYAIDYEAVAACQETGWGKTKKTVPTKKTVVQTINTPSGQNGTMGASGQNVLTLEDRLSIPSGQNVPTNTRDYPETTPETINAATTLPGLKPPFVKLVIEIPNSMLVNDWQAVYDKYKEQSPVNTTNRQTLIYTAYERVTGKTPNYARLGNEIKRCGSGWKVLEAILKMAGRPISDNPMDYLSKIISGDKPSNNISQISNYQQNYQPVTEVKGNADAFAAQKVRDSARQEKEMIGLQAELAAYNAKEQAKKAAKEAAEQSQQADKIAI